MPTFLFTDIEGSTRLWEDFRDAMPGVLARHDEVLSTIIEKTGGRIVKHTGDGVFAVFENGDPLACALSIQESITNENWGDIGEMRVRIALNSGAAEIRAGDYFGHAVNRTARLLSVGHGGQILLTQKTNETCKMPEGAV